MPIRNGCLFKIYEICSKSSTIILSGISYAKLNSCESDHTNGKSGASSIYIYIQIIKSYKNIIYFFSLNK